MNTLVRASSTASISLEAVATAATRLAARTAAALKTWSRRRRSRDELATVDAATLRDIGISRADADFEASKPFWTA